MKSLFGKGKGKGKEKATTQAGSGAKPSLREGSSRPTQRSRRQEVAEEISRQVAQRLQDEEDARYARVVQEMEESGYELTGSGDDGGDVEGGSDADEEGGGNEDEEQGSGDEGGGGDEEEQEQEQPQPPSPPPKEPRSEIFKKHFRRELVEGLAPLADGRRRFKVYCNYCPTAYKWLEKGGYGTMIRHMENHHPMEFGIPTSQTQIQRVPGGSGAGASGTSSSALFKFDRNVYEDAMAKYCAMEKQPFNYADRETYTAMYKLGL